MERTVLRNPALPPKIFRANAGLRSLPGQTQDGNAAGQDLRYEELTCRARRRVALRSRRCAHDPGAAVRWARAPGARGKNLGWNQAREQFKIAFSVPRCGAPASRSPFPE